MSGLIIAAPRSGSGKTIVTLGLARHLRQRGTRIATAKVGPDYIDAGFLAAAGGRPCCNLDLWAMRPATLAHAIGALEAEADFVLCEGVMGLFDGAGAEGAGSTAELASFTGWPVVLVVDLEGQAGSAAALIAGFARHRDDVTIAGVIFNRIGSARHLRMAETALRRALPEMRLLGAIPRDANLSLPSRHLGLVPAGETRALDHMIEGAAHSIAGAIDDDAILALARPARLGLGDAASSLPPLGARIATAHDQAFVFAYDSVLSGWRKQGAALQFFSPLAGEAPPLDADAIYLPGGYPELFAARIAANRGFLDGLRDAARRGAVVYGECGGYMVLGQGLIDGGGQRHAMGGLLPLTTSFAARRLQLGYRAATLIERCRLGEAGQSFRGHEFHYATIIEEGGAAHPLYRSADSDGGVLGTAGLVAGSVMGSFIHLIDHAD